MTDAAVRQRPGGRSARVRQSVLDATLALLGGGGLDKLTVADIAQRAGVHETSIRRRWRTRENLICDALLNYSELHLPIPDTGSLREDLAAFATELAAYLTTPLGRRSSRRWQQRATTLHLPRLGARSGRRATNWRVR